MNLLQHWKVIVLMNNSHKNSWDSLVAGRGDSRLGELEILLVSLSHLLITVNSSLNFAIYCIKVKESTTRTNLQTELGVRCATPQKNTSKIKILRSKTLVVSRTWSSERCGSREFRWDFTRKPGRTAVTPSSMSSSTHSSNSLPARIVP